MPKLALNFICKNEAHIINTMLESGKSIIDLIVANDTGSTDGTQELIKKFGIDNNIPTYVFERPFDDFEKSRNYGLEKLREVVKELGWDPNQTWSMWWDCDEVIVVDPKFTKNQFVNDLYMINTYIGSMKYTRNTFARVSKPFRFYGVVHEFIMSDDKTITSGLAENIHVDVKMTGASWKGNVPEKYKSHAFTLEKYIDANRQDPRWIFYTAQSYHDSACVPDAREENEERLRRSLKYYRERVQRPDGYPEEIFYAQYRIGTIMKVLEEPWNLTLNELMKAYSMDPIRGEPVKAIIDHYLSVNEWNNAYLFSKFAKMTYHQKNPYPQRLLFVDEVLYAWRFLEVHAASSFYTGRREEARQSYLEMVKISKEQPHLFNSEDLQKIQMNSSAFA